MKTSIFIAFTMAALAYDVLAVQEKTTTGNQDAIMPLIAMDQVPLRDAVKNLVQQMSQRNYIFDPRVIASFAGPAGGSANEPNVKGRWEKVTAEQALMAILAEHKLKLVKNPATTVARIVPADEKAAPTPSISSGTNKDQVFPVIMMTDARLGDAITNLAQQAMALPIVLDPQLDAPGSAADGKVLSQSFISFRWEKISAKQALAAVLENYGLVRVPGEAGAPATITRAPPSK